MNYKIFVSENFKRESKRLIKKYSSLKEELLALERQLIMNPRLGRSLGNNCFKIRLAVKSKLKGKRSGVRVITYIVNKFALDKNGIIIIGLLSVYDKSEQVNISDKFIKNLIADIFFEIHT